MCPHYLGHIPPNACPPSHLGRTCSTLWLYNFVEEKNISDKKKNMVFLLL
jgi:hypothetical protein